MIALAAAGRSICSILDCGTIEGTQSSSQENFFRSVGPRVSVSLVHSIFNCEPTEGYDDGMSKVI